MKKLIAFFLASLCVPLALAAANEKEMDRVKDSGVVLKEILGIPDDIPKDLLDRAECVIVLPSVKKLAIGIGGSYGRGVMVCRNGEHFTGSWGAPAMYALEGGNIGFQLGGQATDIDIHAKEILRMRAELNGILVHHTGQRMEKIEKDTDRDFFMTAEQAKDYGIVDAVISTKPTTRPVTEEAALTAVVPSKGGPSHS